jgi:hypothetical protein
VYESQISGAQVYNMILDGTWPGGEPIRQGDFEIGQFNREVQAPDLSLKLRIVSVFMENLVRHFPQLRSWRKPLTLAKSKMKDSDR